jgi:hypothetical protein
MSASVLSGCFPELGERNAIWKDQGHQIFGRYLAFPAHTEQNRTPILEAVFHNITQETITNVAYLGGILDGSGLCVNADLAHAGGDDWKASMIHGWKQLGLPRGDYDPYRRVPPQPLNIG